MGAYGTCDLYTLLFAAIGLIVLFFFLLNSVWSVLQIIRAILGPYFIPQEDLSLTKKYGNWALVTGSTDGIGKEYAKELASRGVNVVLVSRTHERLVATAAEIEAKYPVKTKIIQADFSTGSKAIETIKNELGDLPIGILVNNVGMQYSYPMFVGEVPEKQLWDIITVNVGAVTMMTRLIVNDMKERGRGAIVNVSSGSEMQPLPLMTVYAATKAYIKSFTAALRYEYSKYGITIQHLSPMFINTKMNHFSDVLQEPSLLVPTASAYAKYAISLLGKTDCTTGYWSHGLQYTMASIAPVWLRMYVGGSLNKSFRKEYFNRIRNSSK